mmetsp:Transcript_56411/g.136888  ORF Transcript_56411/g.136888 Transcript_56411/m.136888 type:complete len:741 (+) Transcript_56411:1029-3251(+)
MMPMVDRHNSNHIGMVRSYHSTLHLIQQLNSMVVEHGSRRWRRRKTPMAKTTKTMNPSGDRRFNNIVIQLLCGSIKVKLLAMRLLYCMVDMVLRPANDIYLSVSSYWRDMIPGRCGSTIKYGTNSSCCCNDGPQTSVHGHATKKLSTKLMRTRCTLRSNSSRLCLLVTRFLLVSTATVNIVHAFAPRPQQKVRTCSMPIQMSSPSSSASSADTTTIVKPIKKICIVGAGIAGLSLAHGLINSHDHDDDEIEVSIFDSRPQLDSLAGSGVQLNGGIAGLGKINPKVQKAVIDGALPLQNIEGRHKAWGSEGDVTKLWNYQVSDIVNGAEQSDGTNEMIDENGSPYWYAIMRGALLEILLDELPVSTKKCTLNPAKSLASITSSSETERGAFCQFSDGSTAGPFDLIVGCDGIKSAVKEYVDKGSISDDDSKREGKSAALYSGIRINYAVQDAPLSKTDESNAASRTSYLKQTFADGAYSLSGTFGNGKDRPPCNCFFVTSLDDNYIGPFERKQGDDGGTTESVASTSEKNEVPENVDWNEKVEQSKSANRAQLLKKIQFHGVVDDRAEPIVSAADRFFELGVYFHAPFSLKGWSKEVPNSDGSYCVLCGDSAHAMPPFLGQGANQAVQDAYSLSSRIHKYNADIVSFASADADAAPMVEDGDDETETRPPSPPNLRLVLREYENVRWGPTTSITLKAVILGYLETGGPNGLYGKFRDVFFRILDVLGVPKKVLVDSMTPRV